MSWARCSDIDADSWRWSYHSSMARISTSTLDFSHCWIGRSYWWSLYAHAQEGCANIYSKCSPDSLVLLLLHNSPFERVGNFIV
jgi:hypothetical protein